VPTRTTQTGRTPGRLRGLLTWAGSLLGGLDDARHRRRVPMHYLESKGLDIFALIEGARAR
jgi:hypothetical protein